MSETRHYGPGSDTGARHWAIAKTLIQTAKLNGVDPLAWLTDVLQRIVPGRTKQRTASLLPWNWKAAKAADAHRVASPRAGRQSDIPHHADTELQFARSTPCG